jgi:hypothetical protein
MEAMEQAIAIRSNSRRQVKTLVVRMLTLTALLA